MLQFKNLNFSSVLFFSSYKEKTTTKNITKRLTVEEKSKFTLTDNLKEILIGMILGDAHMRRFSTKIGGKGSARVIFLQSKAQSEFIYHLYAIFQSYCASPPKENFSKIKEGYAK